MYMESFLHTFPDRHTFHTIKLLKHFILLVSLYKIKYNNFWLFSLISNTHSYLGVYFALFSQQMSLPSTVMAAPSTGCYHSTCSHKINAGQGTNRPPQHAETSDVSLITNQHGRTPSKPARVSICRVNRPRSLYRSVFMSTGAMMRQLCVCMRDCVHASLYLCRLPKLIVDA